MNQKINKKKSGLVLTGGGARSAYQAGAMLGIKEILEKENLLKDFTFDVYTGASGGAINCTALACFSHDFSLGVYKMVHAWEHLTVDQVIQITPTQVLSRGLRLFTQLGFGKDENDKVITEILDATPLTNFLKSKLDMKQLYRNLRNKVFYAIGLALTNYATGSNVTVFDGDEEILEWSRSYRLGLRTRLKLRHVLASSAIPFLFPPVKVNNNYFGDGAIRMTAPLSSAIHLGARKLLAVGVRYYRTPEETKVLNMTLKKDKINFSDIAGVMLNALFMDSLDSDVERLETLNRILESHQNFQENYIRKHEVIPVLVIRPSVDLASFAQDLINDLKWIYKHMLKALGTQGEHGSDLLSYLAFDSKYTTRLIELGRIDALAKRDEFLRWLEI